MPVIVDVTCLYSTVKNISGNTLKFPFLPPHGRELDNNEEVTVFGSILEALTRSNDRFGGRDQAALEECLGRDWIEIRNTPHPILTDETTEDLKMIILDNGSLAVADPCFEGSVTV